jgi:hypothetical protein
VISGNFFTFPRYGTAEAPSVLGFRTEQRFPGV